MCEVESKFNIIPFEVKGESILIYTKEDLWNQTLEIILAKLEKKIFTFHFIFSIFLNIYYDFMIRKNQSTLAAKLLPPPTKNEDAVKQKLKKP